ncbi:YkuJ family protein [Vagococcus entomophilus]|uniref:DUF1797 domain-containing protein n=1 Tax=Vagococcus entomophilus TaxID=1160095 RepID=A0A430AIZ2_9ENTE|nr:YkuJ family protein [Vagococcus entomophilus]RSU08070.1 hypothetical protein CBF30_02165 [Vagococcus entomophilus]
MKNSQLVAIIKRLEAMIDAQDNEIQVRRFEKEGNERCVVSYDSSSEMFDLTETGAQQGYEFDDIDLVAMEIYELLQD